MQSDIHESYDKTLAQTQQPLDYLEGPANMQSTCYPTHPGQSQYQGAQSEVTHTDILMSRQLASFKNRRTRFRRMHAMCLQEQQDFNHIITPA
jgi:hypothetical protein